MNARAPMIALKGVRLADGPRQLFDGVDLALEPGVRACLVGRNGAGKSTLMRILVGLAEPDAGDRFLTPSARVVFLAQEPKITGETLLDWATAGGAEPHQAEAALGDFDLDPQRGTQGLSGGEARRAALARAFAEQPDVLLLDEPTNHLDIFAIQTLEAELRASRCAALIVSHDRAFLESVTQRCFWLEDRKLWRLDKGFAAFDDWSEKIAADQAEELRRLSKTIERETWWAQRSITARRSRNEGRYRDLANLRARKAEILKGQAGTLALSIDSGQTSGQRVAEAKGIAKAFGDKTLLKGFSTRIQRGDRVAIVGPNGAGKTTLVKLLLGEIQPDAGEVKLGTNLQIAYVDQSRAQLKEGASLWDALAPDGGDQIMVQGRPKHVAAYAKEFLFDERQLRQPVASLSGGERNRLLLAKALAQPANLMILDEPTNDLDMDTLDLLEEVLADFDGTLILVSHDRDFIDRLATSTIALNGHGQVAETPGGWKDFVAQNPDFFDKPHVTAPPKPAARALAPEKRKSKLSYKDQRRLEELDGLMPRLTGEIAAMEERLHDATLYARDPKGFERLMAALDAVRATLAAAEEEWLELEEKKEALAAG
ncbi:ABC-F family ATP-binding cassette domain-containing protein [Phenylobacterium montanum]|uniref:ABC-F family ATP-binding cassette domain-containing protein n=1 Tax=Phenylobacterium montanum TaxID=2823693 RepID=A0A975ISS3_9CAUL|nr:ABC-F family ATP-binding cassette domain-containing protein [Caulobacter sp. S6]QUD86102.1 ABC-F family ATP-binding cassette domain-containing protein [Caulobacter sp. S6]